MERPRFLTEGAIELHEAACKRAPTVPEFEQHMSKETHVWIAVERHDADTKPWASMEPKDRFLWVKGRSKVLVSKIHESYLKIYEAQNPNLSITLQLDGSTPAMETKVGDLDYFNDKIIVLKTVSGGNEIGRQSGSATPSTSTGIDHAREGMKIYTKSDALSTGAVIVDLPGVHDSNAARAAVAESYMKQCSGLWIVAPINRAVDDKAAKNLLGNSFKRQLKFDGTYSAVSFICSKTDDISRTEAADSLQLGSEMEEIEEKLLNLEHRRKALSKQLNAAKSNKQDHSDAMDDIEDQIDSWETLQTQLGEGEIVYAPSASGKKKRKRVSKSSTSRKKRRRSSSLGSDDDSVESCSEDDDIDETTSPIGPALTEDQIEEKLEELKSLKKDARRERGNLDEQIRDLRKQIEQLEEEEAQLDSRQSELCIAGRNEYSRDAIRSDFAAGIRELDQETAEDEDPDNFNPDEDIRDYDEVARSLPVYCVSSRAYQKLCGRLQKDSDVPGFANTEQTEIPQLQAHCKKLTERGRQASCRRFLNGLDQLLTSLGLWASDDGSGIKLTAQQRDAEKSFLVRQLKELEKALEKTVDRTLNDVVENLDDQLFDKFKPAVDSAAAQAIPSATGWGLPPADGGLFWATYKATVRRQGVFSGAAGHRDFNAQLAEPIYKHLASAWEKLFQRRVNHILQSFTKSGSDLLKKFHSAIETRCREKGHGVGRLGLLGNQLNAYQALFTDLAGNMKDHVNEAQKEINREFTPVITAAMDYVYQMCANESGQGSFKRMKSHMHNHVDSQKGSMFMEACDQVKASLIAVCKEVRKTMLDRVDSVFVNMQRDYMSIIGGVNVSQVAIPREERTSRRQVDEIIGDNDQAFQRVIDSDLNDLKEDDAGGTDEMEVDEGSGNGAEEEFEDEDGNDAEEQFEDQGSVSDDGADNVEEEGKDNRDEAGDDTTFAGGDADD